MINVFISYTSTDRPWAEWLAWVLEENGSTVATQAWDVPAGSNFVAGMEQAIADGQRILFFLSNSSLQSIVSQGDRTKAFQFFLEPSSRQPIPIRVEDVEPLGMLSRLVYIDLVDKAESEAEQAILAVLQERTESDRSLVADAPTTSEETIQVDESDDKQLKLERRYHTVQFFVEPLTDDIGIEMMQIPAGSFLMGSPEDEPERSGAEGPQREVNVATFFMGKYPITQAQWRAVAALPQDSRELKPDPSKFKGEKRPVDHVSWYDAVEFCVRLSAYTNRSYRLPTEVEWEYACRAGTTTPFHFGETITADLANYRGTNDEEYKWSGSYDRGPKGKYREETTPVDYFGNANPFGLCDMHGNVWEWCQDHWHDNYENAPADGSAWLTSNENADRVLRGGSWIHAPRDCRSANRCDNLPDNRYDDFSFRVVCSVPMSLVPLIAAAVL